MSKNKSELLSSLESLESIVQKYDDLLDMAMKNELNLEGFYTKDQVEDHLGSLEKAGRKLKVGVIGRVKAGKSSLINGLLFDGKEVLPKAATPMTAALTSIGYSEKFTAEVKFFGHTDIAQIKSKAQKFDAEVEKLIVSYKEQFSERKKQSSRPISMPSQQKLREKAMRELGENNTLSAAADLYQKIRASNVDVNKLGESTRLFAQSPEELNEQLMEYVGSKGQYMPFTRELNLGMPVESLKGIELLDTPGVNDPVKSREQRAYERLKECNAAFIVSPAGQFMSEQDFELADRLSSREGAQEIFIVASQIDTQLHSSVREDANGVLPIAVEQLKATMAQQAERALSQCDNEVLKRISAEQSKRCLVTSGVCETLIFGGGDTDDSTAMHAMKLLKKSYPDYFSQGDDLISNLKLLSGRESLEGAIESVRENKVEILEQQARNFIDAQSQTFRKVKENILERLAESRSEVDAGDKATMEEKLKVLEGASKKGASSANEVFVGETEEMLLRLPAQLEKVISAAIDEVDERSSNAEGVEEKTRRVEKSGALSWLGRAVGIGGYETRHYSESTLQPKEVRRALEGLSRVMTRGLKDCATGSLLQWRKDLTSSLSSQLRDVVGDEYIDITRLQNVCRKTVNEALDFPPVHIPELPGELDKSRKLTGGAVDDYIEEANQYALALEKAGFGFVDEVRESLSDMSKADIGSNLLKDLIEEMRSLQEMIENKSITLEKMSRLNAELKEL